MLKEMGYQEKIELLNPWLEEIIEGIKRDLRNEHLKIDREFCKRYFLGKNPLQLPASDLAAAYVKDIAQGNSGLGEFIATRWLLRNTDLYGFFEERIKAIHPDFESLEELSLNDSQRMLEQAVPKFGAVRTYIFSIFNSVVFPREVYDSLRQAAEVQTTVDKKEEEEKKSAETLEMLQKRHAREVAALTDNFERKMNGLQKKYLQDMKTLKKQVSLLQKKLDEKA